MRSVPKIRMAETAIALTLLVLLAGVALVSTGCDDGGEADMYSQISAGGPGSTGRSSGSPSTSPTTNTAQQTPPQGGLTGGEAAGLPGAEGEAAEGADEEADDLTRVKGIEILELEVKAPYPDFTGADRYDIKVTLVTEDPVPAQVFSIRAIGENGEVVAEQERDLRLPRKKAGTLHFNDWWCKSIPVTLEFHTTDTQSTSADGTEDTNNVSGRPGGGSRGGSSSGGGASTSGLN